MKKTRSIHQLYKEWQKLPKEITNHKLFGKCIVGKWHYHYKNKNGEIGLVRFNYNLNFKKGKKYCYEACGVLDFQQFSSLRQAETAIYEKLDETIPRKLF